ncbi:MAG: hypothetical protein ACRCZC_07105 [Culicoidibacterales bacterium]
MITQKKIAKFVLILTTYCYFFPFVLYLGTGSFWQSPTLEQMFIVCFPFFPLFRTSPLALFFLFGQILCICICLKIKPQTFTFWIGIGFIALACGYLLFGSLFSIGYFIGGTLLLFHDNTLQFKRITQPFHDLSKST